MSTHLDGKLVLYPAVEIANKTTFCFFCIIEQIDTLETQVVRKISNGSAHNIAVNETGELFTWGDNTQGQLGRGFLDDTFARTPK